MADKKPSWDDTLPVEESEATPTWDDTAPETSQEPQPVPGQPRMSASQAAVESLGQSMSSGFRDEAQGVLGAIYSYFQDPTVREKGMEGLKEEYEKFRNIERAAAESAQKDQPEAYLGGQLLGGVATAAAPGALLSKGAKVLGGTGLLARGAKTVGAAAAEGAVTGVGESTADTLGGVLEDAGAGATVAGITGGTLSGLGKVATKAGRADIMSSAAPVLAKGTSYLSGGKAVRDLTGPEAAPLRQALAEGVDIPKIEKAASEINTRAKEFFSLAKRGETEDLAKNITDMQEISQRYSDMYPVFQEKAVESLRGVPVSFNVAELKKELKDLASSSVRSDSNLSKTLGAIEDAFPEGGFPEDAAEAILKVIDLRRNLDGVLRPFAAKPTADSVAGKKLRVLLNKVRSDVPVDNNLMERADKLYTQKKNIDKLISKASKRTDVPASATSATALASGVTPSGKKISRELAEEPVVQRNLEALAAKEESPEVAQRLMELAKKAEGVRETVRAKSKDEILRSIESKGPEGKNLADAARAFVKGEVPDISNIQVSDKFRKEYNLLKDFGESLKEAENAGANPLAPVLGGILGSIAGIPFGSMFGGIAGAVFGAQQMKGIVEKLKPRQILKIQGQLEKMAVDNPLSPKLRQFQRIVESAAGRTAAAETVE